MVAKIHNKRSLTQWQVAFILPGNGHKELNMPPNPQVRVLVRCLPVRVSMWKPSMTPYPPQASLYVPAYQEHGSLSLKPTQPFEHVGRQRIFKREAHHSDHFCVAHAQHPDRAFPIRSATRPFCRLFYLPHHHRHDAPMKNGRGSPLHYATKQTTENE